MHISKDGYPKTLHKSFHPTNASYAKTSVKEKILGPSIFKEHKKTPIAVLVKWE